MTEPTLNCYIWVVGAHTHWVENGLQLYTPKRIFFYNSLEDRTFKNANYNLTFAFEVQLPEFIIGVSSKMSKQVMNGEKQGTVVYNPSNKKWSARVWS